MMKKAIGMPSESFLPLPKILITEDRIEMTQTLLASFSTRLRPSEGLVYWFGVEFDRYSIVTTLIVPHAEARRGCVTTTEEANAEVIEQQIGTPLILIGQAHSHPGREVGHSGFDDTHTFARFDGAISAVVPNFARGRFVLDQCGIHRHIDGRFVRIDQSEVGNHLQILPGVCDLRHKGEKMPRQSRKEKR